MYLPGYIHSHKKNSIPLLGQHFPDFSNVSSISTFKDEIEELARHSGI